MADYQEEGAEPPPYLYEDVAKVHPENDDGDWREEDFDNMEDDLVCDYCDKVFNDGYQNDITGIFFCTKKCAKAAGSMPGVLIKAENPEK